MDYVKMVCIALVVGVIGPLFWLLVGVLENRIRLLLGRLRQRLRARHAEKSARANGRLL